MSREQKEILNRYVELTEDDYYLEYQYLTNDSKIKCVSYEETIKMLKKDSFILYVGGAWCPNCQASIKFINDAANACDITVYNFDTRIGVDKTFEADIRNCIDKANHDLYKDFIDASDFVHPNGNKTENTDIYRMSVPTILAYKEGKLIDYIADEYFYDGNVLFLPSEYESENKTDYSDVYYNSLISLFEKIK